MSINRIYTQTMINFVLVIMYKKGTYGSSQLIQLKKHTLKPGKWQFLFKLPEGWNDEKDWSEALHCLNVWIG